MKRILVLLSVALTAMVLALPAQAGRFGIKGGINLNSTDFKSASAAGYELGVSWQINLPLWFALQPDVVYSVLGSNVEEVQANLGLGYVKVPVNIQWGPRLADDNIRIFAQVSPFVGYAVAKDASRDWGSIDRFNYGAGMGVGVQLWCFQLTAQYNWNLGALENFSNTVIEDFDKSKVNGATIGLAFLFGKRK